MKITGTYEAMISCVIQLWLQEPGTLSHILKYIYTPMEQIVSSFWSFCFRLYQWCLLGFQTPIKTIPLPIAFRYREGVCWSLETWTWTSTNLRINTSIWICNSDSVRWYSLNYAVHLLSSLPSCLSVRRPYCYYIFWTHDQKTITGIASKQPYSYLSLSNIAGRLRLNSFLDTGR